MVDEEPAAPLMYLEKFFYGTNYYFILIVPKGPFRDIPYFTEIRLWLLEKKVARQKELSETF